MYVLVDLLSYIGSDNLILSLVLVLYPSSEIANIERGSSMYAIGVVYWSTTSYITGAK